MKAFSIFLQGCSALPRGIPKGNKGLAGISASAGAGAEGLALTNLVTVFNATRPTKIAKYLS